MFIYSGFSSVGLGYLKSLVENIEYTFFLTGSQGNGKNYLMRKIGEYFENSAYFFCSFDSSSIDGVLVDNKVLVFDGAYPHNLIPTLYCVNGEVVNLGESVGKSVDKISIKSLYDKEKTAKNEVNKYGKIYNKILDDKLLYYNSFVNAEINDTAYYLFDKVKNNKLIRPYSDVFYYKPKTKKINYSINSQDKFYAKYLLNKLNNMLEKNKIPHITYHNIYNEKFVDAIELNDIFIGCNLAFGENFNIYGENYIDFVNYATLERKITKLQKEALYLHKKLEREYKPFINFENNEMLQDKIITEIKDIIRI